MQKVGKPLLFELFISSVLSQLTMRLVFRNVFFFFFCYNWPRYLVPERLNRWSSTGEMELVSVLTISVEFAESRVSCA